MKRLGFYVLFLTIYSVSTTYTHGQGETFLPFDESLFTPLIENSDNVLQTKLDQVINNNPQYKFLVSKKRLAVGLVDMSNQDHPLFARINGQHMMYAASLPKIAILLATMESIEDGSLIMTKEIDHDLTRMIRYSDNQASTRMIDRLSFEKIEAVLKNKKYQLYDENKWGGGLWVGKRYAAGGRRYPEPMKGLSHAATVNQVCRFYYMLAYGKLVNCDRSQDMLSYLADPGIHHKFVNTLDKVAPEATIYRKSGSWKNYHADSVMVIGDQWRRYILVALVDDPNGEQIIRSIIADVEDIIKPYK